jgi:hypothetical protein
MAGEIGFSRDCETMMDHHHLPPHYFTIYILISSHGSLLSFLQTQAACCSVVAMEQGNPCYRPPFAKKMQNVKFL